MKVGVFHNLPPGGALRVAHEQFARLNGEISSAFFPSDSDCPGLCSSASVHKFDTHRRKTMNKPFGRLNGLLAIADLVVAERQGRRLAEAMDRDGCDVLFTHPCRVTQTPTLLLFAKTPSVYYCHEPFRAMHEAPIKGETFFPISDPLRALYSRMAVKQESDSMRAANLVLCNSFYVREYLTRSYGVNAIVNYPGVDTEMFRPLHRTRERTVLSVGRLSPLKGHDFIMESLSLVLAEKRPGLGVVCGPGNSRQDVERLTISADRLGVKLQLHEDISDEALVELYNTATVCAVAPVLEPLGLVALEALACGTPVVGVAEGGVRETVANRETGYLTNRNPSEFAAAIEEILANPHQAQQMGKAGRERVLEHWNWERSMNQLMSHLEATGEAEL